jgi:hypothetical protein
MIMLCDEQFADSVYAGTAVTQVMVGHDRIEACREQLANVLCN